jgi:hypothetical protein
MGSEFESRIRGSTYPLPHTPSWRRTHGQIYLSNLKRIILKLNIQLARDASIRLNFMRIISLYTKFTHVFM